MPKTPRITTRPARSAEQEEKYCCVCGFPVIDWIELDSELYCGKTCAMDDGWPVLAT